MPAYERSAFGCWTCRVRKKKCDENYPLCLSCVARGITCYGYGPKPEWMDGSGKEKRVVEELKQTIKERQKQKRLSNAGKPSQNAVPFSPGDSVANDQRKPLSAATAPSVTSQSSNLQPDSCTINSTAFSSNPSPCRSRYGDPKEFETTLLMNYLDHVFPIQFNCYTPPVTSLGRGWLLALLTRTKPLYHAALSLSALYMQSILQKIDQKECSDMHWEEMKKHHSLAFKELQVQIVGLKDCHNVKSTIETLACVIQLICFELLRGGTDSWQIHLAAAASLIPTLLEHLSLAGFSDIPQHPLTPPHFNDDFHAAHRSKDEAALLNFLNSQDKESIPAKAESALCVSVSQSQQYHNFAPNMSDIDDVACDFLIGTFIWYDILSCASIYQAPRLPNNHSYLSIYQIRLDKIMGCENWAMILISRVSQLSAWKASQQSSGCLSMKDLISRGSSIEKELNNRLEKNKLEIGKPIPRPESASCQRLGVASSKSNLVITRIFAFAALTYLHTVISGAHSALPEIRSSVEDTMEAFRMIPSATFLRNLVWPFCVTGCMADKEDEAWFERCMKYAETDGEGCPGNIWKAWEVVKESWRMRQELGDGKLAKGVDWVDAMESLGFRILLV